MGHISTMYTIEAKEDVKQVLKDCCHDSSKFQLEHMKKVFEANDKYQAKRNGLDSGTHD